MTDKVQSTWQWLMANAVVLAQKELLGDYPGEAVWCLPDHLHEKLIFKLTEREDHFNQGCTKDHMFLTSQWGLIILNPTSIKKEDLITYNGYRILRTEVNRDHWYLPESTYAKWMTGVTTNEIVSKELDRVEKVRQEEERAAAYRARKARVEAEQRAILPDNQVYQDLITAGMRFDHTFEETDDHRYAMATRARLRELEAQITAQGADGPRVMSAIIRVHYGS